MSQLEDLLQQCTVKLILPRQGGWGTGFFVTPEQILTCVHVVQEIEQPIQVHWQKRELEAVVKWLSPEPFDLALLRVTLPTAVDPPCVYLDEEIRSRDPLYLFGYSDDFPSGCPVTFNCDGLTGDEPKLIKFALGQVRPGMSGSPLLNQRTGKVCGVVKFTRDRSSNLGGGAIPAEVILAQLPDLVKQQRLFHQRDRRWVQEAFSRNIKSTPINDLPQTLVRLIGRDQEIIEVHERLQVEESLPIVAVTGMPGVGKSELALQYAWSHLQDYPGGIIWIDACKDDVATQIVQFARRWLNLTPPDEDDSVKQLAFCWKNWPDSPHPVLLIVDDIDSYEKQLKDYLRGLPKRFHLLLTSRQQLNHQLQQIPLEPLISTQAVTLFESFLPTDPRLKEESAELTELCAWLGYLPLAIEIVAEYMVRDSLSSITEIYEGLQNNSFDDEALSEDIARRGVRAAFNLSWKQLPIDSKYLGCLLSLFAPAPISWSLAKAAVEGTASISSLRLARSNLFSFHLLKQVGDGTVQIHRLLREFFRSKLHEINAETNPISGVGQAVVASARKMPSKPIKQDILAFSDVYLHVEEVLKRLRGSLTDNEVAALFTSLIRYYQSQGRYQKGREWAEEYLIFFEEKFGQLNSYTADAYKHSGLMAFLQSRMDDAKNQLQISLKIQGQLIGEDSLEAAAIQIILAALYRTLGDLEKAEQYANIALSTCTQQLKDNDLQLAEARMTLATIQFMQGQDLMRLETSVSQVLKARYKELPVDHPDTPETLDLLAKIYEKQKRFKEAEPVYVEAKNINERTLGSNHPQTAFSYNNLAKIYQAQKYYAEAEELFIKAVKILRDAEVLDKAGWCQYNLGILYSETKNPDKARTNLKEALKLFRLSLPPNHPYTKQCQDALELL